MLHCRNGGVVGSALLEEERREGAFSFAFLFDRIWARSLSVTGWELSAVPRPLSLEAALVEAAPVKAAPPTKLDVRCAVSGPLSVAFSLGGDGLRG